MKKEKNILKKQTSMKVILNGGKFELDDATIPFQIGFDESVAEKKPAYVLVLDVTENRFDGQNKRITNYDYHSERTLFKLEPVQYLQLKNPGVHHLIFIIFSELNEDDKKFLLEKNSRINYENKFYFDSIEQLELLYGKKEVSYCEEIISVPEEFFAIKPKSGIKKIIWQWVNLWHSLDPIDQCEYRKRAIFAFTTQLIFWPTGFLARLILVTLWTTFFIIFKTIALIFGFQPVKFIPYKKKVWYEFLLCYPMSKFEVLDFGDWVYRNFNGEFEEGYYPYKTLGFGDKRIHIPVSLAEIIAYIVLLSIYTLFVSSFFYVDFPIIKISFGYIVTVAISVAISNLAVSQTLPTLKNSERWREKWNYYRHGTKLKKTVNLWIFSLLTGISLLSFMITQIPWQEVLQTGIQVVIFITILLLVCGGFYFLIKFLLKKVEKTKKNIEQTQAAEKNKKLLLEEKRKKWLLTSFNINKLPKKVDLELMPESSSPVHKFVIGFWRAKAKVCKPYAK